MGHGHLTDTLERVYNQSLETRDFAGAIVGEDALTSTVPTPHPEIGGEGSVSARCETRSERKRKRGSIRPGRTSDMMAWHALMVYNESHVCAAWQIDPLSSILYLKTTQTINQGGPSCNKDRPKPHPIALIHSSA